MRRITDTTYIFRLLRPDGSVSIAMDALVPRECWTWEQALAMAQELVLDPRVDAVMICQLQATHTVHVMDTPGQTPLVLSGWISGLDLLYPVSVL